MPGEWLAQLPEDLRTNEAFTGHATLGDFAKSHLEAQGKLSEFDGKVKNFEGKVGNLEKRLTDSIPKLSEKPTDAEISAYRKVMGVPEKPEDYSFPKTEGMENSPEMVKWAGNVFHKHHISKAVGEEIGGEWNNFIAGIVQAEVEADENERVENEKKFRAEFKTEEEFKAGMELTKRFWKKITNTDFDEAYKEAEAWQVPAFMRFIFTVAKATGEDISPMGSGGGGEVIPQMIYDKTPGMGAQKK